MGILRTTLIALAALLAVGASLAGAGSHPGGPRLVQTTLDTGARPWR